MRIHARRGLTVAAAAVAVVLATAGVALAAPPAALPGNADPAETRWQPAYDYDTDGCYPTPAIGPTGTLNGGLKPSGALNGNCRDRVDLDNTNGYSRYRCDNGWCAYAYALYFEKDQVINGVESGHRHDWEHVVVWVQNGTARYVSTSAHGNFVVNPASAVRWDGTHPKIVYHKDGAGSHAFRLANAGDDPPENHYRTWRYPTLVGWNGYPAGIRAVLSGATFGSAVLDLTDSRFDGLLQRARPAGIAFGPGRAPAGYPEPLPG